MGCKHRLSNPGRTLLELIEVQRGQYLGEDDIVRFQDRYGCSDLNNRDSQHECQLRITPP